jgi:CHASE2 domain-containing sensor protein
MLSGTDIIEHEIVRLQHLIENRKFLGRLSRSKAALLVIAVMVLIFQMRNLPETLANSSLDAAIAIERPVQAKSVRLVTIDDNDYAALFHSRSPLDASTLAKLLDAVAKGHPRAIVVDIDTSDASFRDMPTPQVPIVWNASDQEFADGKFTVYAPLGGRTMPPNSVLALAVAPQDDRGIVRGYQHTYLLESGGTVDSPGYAAARIDLGHAPAEPSSHGGETHYLDYRYRFVPVKAQDLVADAESDAWDKMALFAGQVVVDGGTYRAGRDQYATPKGLMNGCEIVAQSAAAEIDGTFISSANRWTTGLLMVLGGLITMAVYHWLKFRMAFLVSLVMVPALSIASNFILFHRFAAWGAMVPLVIAVIVAELYSEAALYLTFYQKVATLRSKDQPATGVPAAPAAK